MKRTPLFIAACVIGVIPLASSQAKQQCHAEALPAEGSHWAYRIIDGRKCWYAGKPMLSKSLLEWPILISSKTIPVDQAEAASVRAPSDVDDFEARWRYRFLDAMGKY
jgi:hypothetical protein